MTTIGDTISRIRNTIKAVKEDAFLTDRFIYSLVLKYAKMAIKRQDNENKIMRFQSLFEPLPCVELIEVDNIEACCTGIKTGCTFRRTKDRLPQVLEGSYGPLFRNITSIDGSQEVFQTYPSIYLSMTNTTSFKYNTKKYYWYLDGYLYFPNLTWEAVRIEGLWDEDVSYLKCGEDICKPRQDSPTRIPEYLFAEIEQLVLRDMGVLAQMPVASQDDKQDVLR